MSLSKILFSWAVMCTLFLLLQVGTVQGAESEYTLPYPSYMPGHRLYTAQVIWDRAMEWWYFGDIAKTKYHLELSDRTLVQARTLFDYKQYLLATESLSASNIHFISAVLYASDVESSHKDGGLLLAILRNAADTHTKLLDNLAQNYTEDITWSSERQEPVLLPVPFLLRQSLIIRSYAKSN
jgi:hypothetical protein